ncbi:MAG: hypothetical protein WCJ26_11735 [bacterium]
MKKVMKSIFIMLVFVACLIVVSAQAQVTWTIKLIQPGLYQVTIKPLDTILQVNFKAVLVSPSQTTDVEKEVTNSNCPELFPEFTYVKRYYCDNSVSKVIGEILTCLPHVTMPSGVQALIMPIVAPPSIKINESGKKKELEDDKTDQKIIVKPFELIKLVTPFCQNIQPNFKDLDDWLLENNSNKLQVEVTIVNQSTPDGRYFYTAWGKSFFTKGSGNEGPCVLTTNPNISLLYSDRYYTVPGNPNNLSQRFSFNNPGYNQSLKLDLARSEIIIKSVNGTNEETFSNVIRTGYLIYGINNTKMVILNLSKSK